MPSKRKVKPKRQPEFRLRLTPADRKWHATVTKHAARKYPSVGAFLRQAITVLYAIETRPTVSSGPVPPVWVPKIEGGSLTYEGPPLIPYNVITATVTDDPNPTGTTTAAMVPGMWHYTQSDPAADSLTHPEE